MSLSTETYTFIGIISSNIFGLGLIGKWILKGVNTSNENLPVILAAVKTLQENDKELMQSRNEHALHLERLQTSMDKCPSCNGSIQVHTHQRVDDFSIVR